MSRPQLIPVLLLVLSLVGSMMYSTIASTAMLYSANRDAVRESSPCHEHTSPPALVDAIMPTFIDHTTHTGQDVCCTTDCGVCSYLVAHLIASDWLPSVWVSIAELDLRNQLRSDHYPEKHYRPPIAS